MRNNVPGGESVGEFPPPGVERAGGTSDEDLIERLREAIRVLEQVPVSLTFPPALGSGPPSSPACSLLVTPPAAASPGLGEPANSNPSPCKVEGGAPGFMPGMPGGGHSAGSTIGLPPTRTDPLTNPRADPLPPTRAGDPLPNPPPYRGREFPWNKLEAAGLHELKPASYHDTPAALAFALAVLGARMTRRDHRPASTFLWCLTERAAREWGAPYGPGLLGFGLDPARLLIVQTRTALEAAWALEEGLKAQAFTAALGQIEVKAPLMARRLGLAAQTSRTPCLLLSNHQGSGLPGTLTRWRIEAAMSRPALFDASAPGAPTWRLTLERCRGVWPSRSWIVEYRHDAYGVRLSAELADRAAEAGEEKRALSG